MVAIASADDGVELCRSPTLRRAIFSLCLNVFDDSERKRSSWLDALFGPAAGAHDYVRSHGLKVHDVMTRDPVTVAENTPQAVRIMGAHSVKRLPVMRRGKLVASSAAPT